jgi:hypothetical protein
MCIIAYHPNGAKLLDMDTLHKCFKNNDDGAGFAYWDVKEQYWYVEKGFMTWKAFKKAFKKHEFTKEDAYVCHFRIGTSGNKDGGNTHPFMITKDRDAMRKTEFRTKNLAIHNGVVGRGDGIYSDTVCHISTYLAPILKHYKQDGENLRMIVHTLLKTDNNRWFFTMGRKVHMWGDWKEGDGKEYEGQMYSNDTYKRLKYVPVQPHNYNNVEGYNNPHYQGYGNNYSRHQYQKKTSASVSEAIKKGQEDAKKEDVDSKSVLDKRTKGKPLSMEERKAFINEYGDIDPGCRYDVSPEDLTAAYVDSDGAIIFETDSEGKLDYICCPSCAEDKHILDSPYTVGDSMCKACGAVFWMHTGEIETFDYDTASKDEPNEEEAHE